ncbi:hypothetical protein V6U77_25995 [Micromonospora sp. CPCC 205546]|uniref:hypothetical protein n=1 Tax=Micromonospora sp. CPCC 205546 TaxID=3122397 RepID=UPI002FF0480E
MDTVVARFTTVDGDEDGTEEAAGRLLQELRQADGVVSLGRAASGAAPPSGARAGELVELGTLLAALVAHADVVSGVLRVVGDWQSRRGRGRVEVRIGEDALILDDATADQQRRLTDAFIDRVFPTAR